MVYTKFEYCCTHRFCADKMEKIVGKKEKRKNKGTDKPYMAQYNLSYLMFVPNFKILAQVVPEKSLTKISIFITLE